MNKQEKELRKLLGTSVSLLCDAYNAIKKRRFLEGACGYPESYGGDEDVMKRMEKFFQQAHKFYERNEKIPLATRKHNSKKNEGR